MKYGDMTVWCECCRECQCLVWVGEGRSIQTPNRWDTCGVFTFQAVVYQVFFLRSPWASLAANRGVKNMSGAPSKLKCLKVQGCLKVK